MRRIATLFLLMVACPVIAQQNCDPALGAVDTSCLEETPAVPSSNATTAKDALLEFYSGRPGVKPPRFVRKAGSASLLICFDLCDVYRTTRLTDESDLWDVAFLHEYHFDDGTHLEEFRSLYAALSGTILKRHAGACVATEEKELAKCALDGLVRGLGIRAWLVRGDEGGYCEMERRLTDPSFLGPATCRESKSN